MIEIFKRKIYGKMLEWKKESDGRSALLIEGARRVGKSTIVEIFAKEEYDSYILIDFSTASSEIRNLFSDISDLNYVFLQLQLQYHKDLHERKSLIIFDEVQFCPQARQAIKTLVKDHRYDYIETGSLISIKRNVKDILIPSEEYKIMMYPMDYEEFLWAIGDMTSTGIIKDFFCSGRPLGDDTNRKLMRNFRLYMLIGGMPQAVSEYITTNNFKSVDIVKRKILKLYQDDFMKIDPTGKISLIFEAIPSQLNTNASRYKISGVLKNERANSILELITQLKESCTVLVSYHANDPYYGMAGNINLNCFKLFLSDTGLFTTLMFQDKDFIDNDIYEKLLNDKLGANLGYLYENIAAQTLAAKGDRLYYYTFSNAVSKHNYEIDFLLARKGKICPVEIKSSGYKTHASLDAFSEKYSQRILNKYLVYTKDYKKDKDIFCIPIYMLQFI